METVGDTQASSSSPRKNEAESTADQTNKPCAVNIAEPQLRTMSATRHVDPSGRVTPLPIGGANIPVSGTETKSQQQETETPLVGKPVAQLPQSRQSASPQVSQPGSSYQSPRQQQGEQPQQLFDYQLKDNTCGPPGKPYNQQNQHHVYPNAPSTSLPTTSSYPGHPTSTGQVTGQTYQQTYTNTSPGSQPGQGSFSQLNSQLNNQMNSQMNSRMNSQMYSQRLNSTTTDGQTTSRGSVVSSRVISVTPLGQHPEKEKVTFIEVPVVEEVVKRVPVETIVERERHIPRIEKIQVPKPIDVPQLTIVEKHVDVPIHKEVVKTVPVKKVVEVAKEVVEPVHTVETRTIDQEIEVLGEVVQVPKPFLIENRVVVPRFVDFKIPTVVSQSLKPTFIESKEHAVEVRLREYVPELIPINVFLPRPIERNIVVAGDTNRRHVPVEIPLAHYNSLIGELNKNVPQVLEHHPAVKNAVEAFEARKAMEEQQMEKSGAEQPAAITTLANIGGQLTEVHEVERLKHPSFWADQMLCTAPNGATPVLRQDINLVFPEGDDWKPLYDSQKDYVLAA